MQAHEGHPQIWAVIKRTGNFAARRTNVDLKDKWRNMGNLSSASAMSQWSPKGTVMSAPQRSPRLGSAATGPTRSLPHGTAHQPLTFLDLPPELVVRAIAAAPMRSLATLDCVSTVFHRAPPPQQGLVEQAPQQGLVEQALRLKFAVSGRTIPPALPAGQSWTQALLEELLEPRPVSEAPWAEDDARVVKKAHNDAEIGLVKMRSDWKQDGLWPVVVEKRSTCTAALRRRGAYRTVAVSPAPMSSSPRACTTGPCGPDMLLYCWGDGKASIVGFPDEPSEEGGDSTKADLQLHNATATLHIADLGIFSADRRYGNHLVNGSGQLFRGIHGASVSMVQAGQSFPVRVYEDGYDDPPMATVTTQPGDLEVVVYLSTIWGGSGCGIAYLMRKRDNEDEDEEAVMRRFKGLADDWSSSGNFGGW